MSKRELYYVTDDKSYENSYGELGKECAGIHYTSGDMARVGDLVRILCMGRYVDTVPVIFTEMGYAVYGCGSMLFENGYCSDEGQLWEIHKVGDHSKLQPDYSYTNKCMQSSIKVREVADE